MMRSPVLLQFTKHRLGSSRCPVNRHVCHLLHPFTLPRSRRLQKVRSYTFPEMPVLMTTHTFSHSATIFLDAVDLGSLRWDLTTDYSRCQVLSGSTTRVPWRKRPAERNLALRGPTFDVT